MTISIFDELLRDEEEPPPRPRRGPSARRMLRHLLVTGAVTAVVLAGLRAIGVAVSVFAVVAGVVTLLVVRRAAARVAPPPPPPGGPAPPVGDLSWASRDGLHQAIGRWERILEWSGTDADRYNSRVLRRLGALADERMRQRHGFTRDSDPVRARALLGEAVWTALATDVRRPPSPRDLAAIVAELEKI